MAAWRHGVCVGGIDTLKNAPRRDVPTHLQGLPVAVPVHCCGALLRWGSLHRGSEAARHDGAQQQHRHCEQRCHRHGCQVCGPHRVVPPDAPAHWPFMSG